MERKGFVQRLANSVSSVNVVESFECNVKELQRYVHIMHVL